MGLAVLAFGDVLCGFSIDLMLNPMGKIIPERGGENIHAVSGIEKD
jgi:hypothetical protein